jgi:hypothetical protein
MGIIYPQRYAAELIINIFDGKLGAITRSAVHHRSRKGKERTSDDAVKSLAKNSRTFNVLRQNWDKKRE